MGAGYEFAVPSATTPRLPARTKNLGQLYFNHHFDQLSRRTPPAIVSRERREKPRSPLSAPATAPTTNLQFRRSLRLSV